MDDESHTAFAGNGVDETHNSIRVFIVIGIDTHRASSRKMANQPRITDIDNAVWHPLAADKLASRIFLASAAGFATAQL